MLNKLALFGVLLLLQLVVTQIQNNALQDRIIPYTACDVNLHGLRNRRSIPFLPFPFVSRPVTISNPFHNSIIEMRFFLFRREFRDCGKELKLYDRPRLLSKGFDPQDPTRIIVHGWLDDYRGALNRDVLAAYLERGNFNIIIADWSDVSHNLNYFSVAKMVDTFGALLADFTTHLNLVLDISYNSIYIIGHSLGAHIAGAAGRRIRPFKYNTIFALDPAGPGFRDLPEQFRINPSDARYVESIQTSVNLGFLKPTGTATFYPNWGYFQKNCLLLGCSHARAYQMFAESVNSNVGFWGARCTERSPRWECENMQSYKMGGEPSTPKQGMFYVETNAIAPFARGRYVFT